MEQQMDRENCLLALATKARDTGRLPKKSDFSEFEVARIKAFFGPWPRALEAAGLIPSKEEDREAKKNQKRILAKRQKIEALKKQRN